MPFYLKDRDASGDIAGLQSVLIVPCRFCPAASLAVRERKPFLALFRKFLRTPAYEAYIQKLKSRLERVGIRTGIFHSRFPNQFVLCMWSAARRRRLARRALGYQGLVVLGCDAAVETARSCVRPGGCRVIPGMEVDGIMNVIPALRFPFNIWLEVSSVTRVLVGEPKLLG